MIYCTRKLLKELGYPQAPDIPADYGVLGNWYGNMITIDWRRCLLFTNERTFYRFLVPEIGRRGVNNVVREFLVNLTFNLQTEGFSAEVISQVMSEYEDIGFARIEDGRALKVMKDFAFGYKFHCMKAGGLNQIRIAEVNRLINRTPLSPLNYRYPVDVLRELLNKTA